MENRSISLASIQKAAVPRTGVVGNPYLTGGYLIGSSLLGLLVIIGAFLYNRRNLSLFKRSCIMSLSCREHRLIGVQVIHNSLLTLLTMDALNLIAAIVYGAAEVASSCYYLIDCDLAEDIWFLSRWFGVIIHLVNASLCIYHLCQPLSVTRVRIAYALVCVVIIIIVPLYVYFQIVSIFILAGFMFLFALAVIETSRALTSSPSTATLKKLIVVVAMCNFLVVYIPTFILQCLKNTVNDFTDRRHYQIVYENVLIFTNLHLIFDGLQCALVLKLPSGEEQQQQQQQELKQWEPQQQQQMQPQQQQQWRQQQQQNLGSQNAGFTGSTNVYQ